MARSKLKSALYRHQGRDLKLEKQKKHQKEAERKRRQKKDDDEEMAQLEAAEEQLEREGGILEVKDFSDDGVEQEDAIDAEAEEWETDEEEEEEDESQDDQLQFTKVDRFNAFESEDDSDSEDDDDEDGDEPSGVPLQATPLKSILKASNGSTDSGPRKKTNNGVEFLEEEAEEESDEEDEDIPLSDIEDASNSDEEQDIVPYQRLTINNTGALERALASIALPISKLDFSDHQSLTTSEPVNISDTNDDLNRELAFYSQCLAAAKEARTKLRKEGIPFTRPTDYFAEMVKSDEHMGKVKGKLVADAAGRKAAADARKQRDLKKFGKQVQQEKLKERAREKKATMDKVNSLKRKRQGAGLDNEREDDLFDVSLDDAATSDRKGRGGPVADKRGGKGVDQRGAKRIKKDEKFGFGGKKRFKKSGDAASSADMRGFSNKRMKAQPKTGASKRLGKDRRAKRR